MTNREQPADFEAWYAEQYESPQWSHCKNAMHDAWDAALVTQDAPKAEAPVCQDCGEPQSPNPHPKAGDPSLEFGYQWHCIPCLVKSRASWASRCHSAENALREALAHAQRPAPDLDRESRIVLMMYALHSNVPEDDRPMARSDFSDEQWARAEAAFEAAQRPAGPATPEWVSCMDCDPYLGGRPEQCAVGSWPATPVSVRERIEALRKPVFGDDDRLTFAVLTERNDVVSAVLRILDEGKS